MKFDKDKLKSNVADNSFISLMGGKANGIIEIPIADLVKTEDQPFNVFDDEDMKALVQDIKINGVLEPIIVVEENNKYRILAGHRRTYASKHAGMTVVPAIVKDVGSGNQKLIITNTNLTQRKKFLPSELAKAYKLQQEGYQELNAHSVRTTAQMAEENNVSKRTIQYYLKLNDLIPDLLLLVDDEIITIKAGAVLSKLSTEEQEILRVFILNNEIKKIDLNYAIPITSPSRPVTVEYLTNLFFPTKDDELSYDSYIVNRKTIEEALSKSRQKIILLDNHSKLKDGVTLKKADYKKLIEAQYKLEKQLEIIEKIIDKA